MQYTGEGRACQGAAGTPPGPGRPEEGTITPQDADTIWTRLRQAGLRVTPLRRRLVTLFASSGRWYSPQELGVAAARVGLRPGRATVYRLIDALMEAGLCKSYPQANRVMRYVFCLPEHHHHMICLDCGKVEDFAVCRVKAPDATFAVSEHAVDFFGTCAACQKKTPPSRRPRS